MKRISLLLSIFMISYLNGHSQDYLTWDDHSVDEFYEKTELPAGTLDESGQIIEFVFVKTSIKEGIYDIEITDGPGELYEIKGTDYFIEFKGYYGYAGYADEGILVVGTSAWYSTFYEKE